ncbi:hypothetical protein [Chloroflexus aurantiacus]
MAQKVGTLLGRGTLLFRALPARESPFTVLIIVVSTLPVGEVIRNLEFGVRRHSLVAIISYPERKRETMFRPGVIGWK